MAHSTNPGNPDSLTNPDNQCIIIDETEHLIRDSIDQVVIGPFNSVPELMDWAYKNMVNRDWYWLPIKKPVN